MTNTCKIWCICLRRHVEHRRIGVQNFGWALIDMYRCAKCGTLKPFPIEKDIFQKTALALLSGIDLTSHYLYR